MASRIWKIFPLLACLISVSGCGGAGNELGRLPVSGKVTFGGEPLANGTIAFDPVGTGTQSGAVIENGAYQILAQRGLPPGEYVVRISSAGGPGAQATEAPGESSQVAPELIPENFNAKSDQKVTVKAGEENAFDFTIPKGK